MKCPSCAKELKPELKFCPHCGIRIASPHANKAPAPQAAKTQFVHKKAAENSAAKWRSFFIIIALLVSLSGGYVALDGYQAEKNYKECALNRKTGTYMAGAAFCEKSLKRRPRRIEAWAELAKCYQGMKNQEKTYTAVKSGLKWGENADLLAIHGQLLIDKSNFKEAKKSLSRALKLEPGNRDANHQMGFLLLKIGEPEKAIPCLEKALKNAPREDHILINKTLGDIYAEKGDHKNAAESYRNALKKDMNVIEICLKLAKEYLALSKLDAAAGEAERCALISPENSEAAALKEQVLKEKDMVDIVKYVKTRKKLDDIFIMIYSSIMSFIERVNKDPDAFVGQETPELDDMVRDTNNLMENYRKLAPPSSYYQVHSQTLTSISTMNDTIGYLKTCVKSGEEQRCRTLAEYITALETRMTQTVAIWEKEYNDMNLKDVLKKSIDVNRKKKEALKKQMESEKPANPSEE